MSNIHYFQRYSSPENTVTNNTLQLIARIYEHSVGRLNMFLETLLGESVNVGIEISQQERGEDSVPDGVVLQRGFKLVIEAKVNSGVNEAQLLNHCKELEDAANKFLILLTVAELTPGFRHSLEAKIRAKDADIKFRSFTYRDICNALEGLFQEYEAHIFAIAEDYTAYCRDRGLVDNVDSIMRVVPTGTSFDLNKQYAMYFQPSDRGYSRHTYIGFYRNKAVEALGKVVSVFDVTFDGGRLAKEHISGEATDRFDSRIVEMIPAAKAHCGYDVHKGHRFFCMDEVVDTHFKKTTARGIQGARFFDLAKYVDDDGSVQEIAARLNGKSWEQTREEPRR